MSHATIKMGDRGRIVIPGDIRKRLGLQAGDSVLLTEDENGIRLRPLDDRIDALRGSWAALAPGASLADELIADRRVEAERE